MTKYGCAICLKEIEFVIVHGGNSLCKECFSKYSFGVRSSLEIRSQLGLVK